MGLSWAWCGTDPANFKNHPRANIRVSYGRGFCCPHHNNQIWKEFDSTKWSKYICCSVFIATSYIQAIHKINLRQGKTLLKGSSVKCMNVSQKSFSHLGRMFGVIFRAQCTSGPPVGVAHHVIMEFNISPAACGLWWNDYFCPNGSTPPNPQYKIVNMFFSTF